MFKNWKRIAEKAAARADSLESAKRMIEHKNDYLRTERVKMLKKLDALNAKVAERELRLEQIAACETPSANATVRRMARIARCEDSAPTVRVNPGPVPNSLRDGRALKEALQECLAGNLNVVSAFTWHNSKQGDDYWHARSHNGLDNEAREIIKAWIAELESKQ